MLFFNNHMVVPYIAIHVPTLYLLVRVHDNGPSHPCKMEVEMSKKIRRKDQDIPLPQLQHQTSLMQHKLSSLSVPSRDDNTYGIVIDIYMRFSANLNIEHKTGERVC